MIVSSLVRSIAFFDYWTSFEFKLKCDFKIFDQRDKVYLRLDAILRKKQFSPSCVSLSRLEWCLSLHEEKSNDVVFDQKTDRMVRDKHVIVGSSSLIVIRKVLTPPPHAFTHFIRKQSSDQKRSAIINQKKDSHFYPHVYPQNWSRGKNALCGTWIRQKKFQK